VSDVETPDAPPSAPIAVTRRKSKVARYVVIPIAIVAALLVGILATSKPATDRLADSPLLDQLAPPIEGTTTEGEAFDIDSLRGQWVLVNFFATWCVPCRQEQPELVSFSNRHGQIGDATVISVAFDDTAENVQQFFDEHGGEWPVIAANEGRIALDYGVSGVPESFLIDPDGYVRAKVTGGVTSAGLDRLLTDLSGRGQ
jgi:cytochrome c biogenesis protein CcmG/thiol:disulfide interchange protein DsbE